MLENDTTEKHEIATGIDASQHDTISISNNEYTEDRCNHKIGENICLTEQKRRANVHKLLTCLEIIPLINLHELEVFANSIHLQNTFLWIEYLDILLDLRLYILIDKPPKNGLVQDLEEITEALVRQLDRDQLIKMRFFYTCIEQRYENTKPSIKANTQSTISKSKFSVQSSHNPDYLVTLAVYDLHSYDTDANISIKFFGSHTHDTHIYESIEILVSQIVNVIEGHNNENNK